MTPEKIAEAKALISRADKTLADARKVLGHGGRRPGAGRKAPDGPQVTRSIAMPADAWQRFDAQRGDISRGRWLAKMLDSKKVQSKAPKLQKSKPLE
jgi:hypothetical protein